MSDDAVFLQEAIKRRWAQADGPKVKRYVDKFWDRSRRERRITAVVQGNHGNYTVSIEAQAGGLSSTCSCYIGKSGGCHHCAALGMTYLTKPDSFTVIEPVEKTAVTGLDSLKAYLNSVTLDELAKEMRAKGITQKGFCEAVGMSTQHFSAVKSSELRNRRFHELGATKLAVMWAMEHLGD